MNSKSSFRKGKVFKYVIVLVVAIIVRILFAFVLPLEAQKYVGLFIIIAAIIAYFTWNYIDVKKKK